MNVTMPTIKEEVWKDILSLVNSFVDTDMEFSIKEDYEENPLQSGGKTSDI